MQASPYFLETVQEQIYICQAFWSNIRLPLDEFADYVWQIVRKHLKNTSDDAANLEFMKKLYVRDLFLACACVRKDENAWKAFDLRYRNFVTNLVRFCYRHGTDHEEIADLILVNLFFDDRSGRKRIASYDGRSSLATWLRVIVINRAINEKNNRRVALDESLEDIPDCRALINIESTIKARRYTGMLSAAICSAIRQLTDAERLLLLWRYDRNLPLGEVARLLGIHQANVTRRLVRLQTRLRETVIHNLSTEHAMGSAAIQECLADIIDNPLVAVPILGLLKSTPSPPAPVREKLLNGSD